MPNQTKNFYYYLLGVLLYLSLIFGFIFNENLADKILLGGSNSYKDKYLCYKNKYLKLKAQLNN